MALTTEQMICPYCRTKFNYVVLNPTIMESIDALLQEHRWWCKSATEDARKAWKANPTGIPYAVAVITPE